MLWGRVLWLRATEANWYNRVMPISQQDVSFLLEGLMPGDRKNFHNSMRGFLSHAAKVMPELPSQGEMHEMVEYSRSVSPASAPSAWLNFLLESWKNTPGKRPEGYSPADLTCYLSVSLGSVALHQDKQMQKHFREGCYPQAQGPRIGTYITTDKVEAEKSVAAYQKEFSPSTGAVLALGNSSDGEYLALAYYNEDITTSHIFQAMKFMGYRLDEQAKAQLEAYDEVVGADQPHSLTRLTKEIAHAFPFKGLDVPIADLHGLHSQPHRYDQEALDFSSNDIGIA